MSRQPDKALFIPPLPIVGLNAAIRQGGAWKTRREPEARFAGPEGQLSPFAGPPLRGRSCLSTTVQEMRARRRRRRGDRDVCCDMTIEAIGEKATMPLRMAEGVSRGFQSADRVLSLSCLRIRRQSVRPIAGAGRSWRHRPAARDHTQQTRTLRVARQDERWSGVWTAYARPARGDARRGRPPALELRWTQRPIAMPHYAKGRPCATSGALLARRRRWRSRTEISHLYPERAGLCTTKGLKALVLPHCGSHFLQRPVSWRTEVARQSRPVLTRMAATTGLNLAYAAAYSRGHHA